MTLATLAIQTEAWVQEEIDAQLQLLTALTQIETAARAGGSAQLEHGGRELEALLSVAPVREARRRALLARLAPELGLPLAMVTLTRLVAHLRTAALDTQRVESLRSELREIVAAVLKIARRLAALAQYHPGFFDELCALFARAGSTPPSGDGPGSASLPGSANLPG